MKKALSLVAFFTLAVAPIATGEDLDDHVPPWSTLQVGDRVRLRTGTGRVTGQVFGLDDAGLLIQRGADPGPVRIPLEGVERLEVARGKKGHTIQGAVVGFVPGALALGYTMAAFACWDEPSDCRGTEGWVVGSVLGGGVTAGIGALIGLAIRTERWTPVATDVQGRRPTVGLGFAPAPGGGLGLALSVRF